MGEEPGGAGEQEQGTPSGGKRKVEVFGDIRLGVTGAKLGVYRPS